MELNTWQSRGLLSGAELDPVKLFPLKSCKERALTSWMCKLYIRRNINSPFMYNKRAVVCDSAYLENLFCSFSRILIRPIFDVRWQDIMLILCAPCHLTWQPFGDDQSSRLDTCLCHFHHLWHLKLTIALHTVALQTTKGGSPYPEGPVTSDG